MIPLGAEKRLIVIRSVEVEPRSPPSGPVPYYKVLEDRQSGYLESLYIVTDNQNLAVYLETDHQIEEYKISDIADYGIYDYVPGMFYLEKYDPGTPLFVLGYVDVNGEPYNERIRILLKNYDTANKANVPLIRVKRWVIKEEYH